MSTTDLRADEKMQNLAPLSLISYGQGAPTGVVLRMWAIEQAVKRSDIQDDLIVSAGRILAFVQTDDSAKREGRAIERHENARASGEQP